MTADEIRRRYKLKFHDAKEFALFEIAAQMAEFSLRDRFALAAMQGMLASCNGPAWGNEMFPLAESAYAYADAMLKERAK